MNNMKTNLKFLNFFILLVFYLIFGNLNLLAQVWNREAVDSTGINNGAFCSLEIDNNNVAHIAYMDADFYDLKYAIKSSGEWVVSIIDSLRYTGISSDLALDSENRPHICFQEGCDFVAPCPDAGLKYMTKTAGGWIKETVDEFLVFTGYMDQTYCSIQLNSHDQPVIAYYKVGEDAVKLAYKDETGWNKKEYQLNNPPVYLSLSLKSDDTPVLQYILNDSLHVTTYDMDTGEWEHYGTPEISYVMMFKGGYNFDIDNEDKLHFVFPSFENGLPLYKYIYFNWQEWTKEFLPEGGPFYIKVNRDDKPYVVNFNNGISICKKEGTQWTCELINKDFSPEDGYASFASLDFDNNNNAQIAVYGSIPELSDEKSASLMYYSFHPGSPDMEISATSYDFGEVWTQSYMDGYLVIKNAGIAPLVIANLQFESTNPFEVVNMPETVFIQVGDSLKINVRFTPTLEQAYSEVLKLITNDPIYPTIDITFVGTGVSSGTTASLNVQVNDVFVDMDYLIINKETPLSGAGVVLYKNSQIIEGSLSTNYEGQLSFENLSPGFYEVKISKMLMLYQEETLLASSETIEIGPGANTHLMLLPDSLYQYKYQLLEELNEIKDADYLLTGEYFSYENVESKVDAKFKEWAIDYDPQRTESLARLILVETMVKDLFDEGLYVSNEMFADFGNLIGFIFYMDDWGMSIIEFFKAAIKSLLATAGGGSSGARDLFEELLEILKKELIKRHILLSITEAVQLIGSELPRPADIIINEAWKEVKKEYSSMPNLSFGSVAWDEITSSVRKILKDPFIQMVYIEMQTSPSIKDALDYSIINDYNGTFTAAFRHEIDFVSDQKNDVEVSIEVASNLRKAANLFMITANILDMAAAFDPTGMLSFAEELSSYLRISAYVEVITALGISTSEFFILPSNMKDVVDDIYFPEPKSKSAILNEMSINKKSKYGSFNEQNIKELLFAKESSYDSVLHVIKDKIVSGDRQDAVFELFNLRDFGNNYSNQIKQAYAPVSAVAKEANESISGFIPMYDSLISYKALSDQEKMITFLKVFCVAFDSTGQITNTVLAQIDRTIQVNHTLTSHISGMLDLVSANMELPGVIVASMLKQEKHSLDIGEEDSVLLKIKNVGAVKTDNICLRIETNDALTYSGSDSILVGSLEPGEESDEFNIVFNLASKDYKTGLWDILIECDDAVTFSPSGSFSITETPTIINENTSIKESDFYCYPNPLNSTGIIFYKLNKRAKLKIDLYDLSGRKIKPLFNNFQEAGDSYLPWSASSLANGMYIIKLQVDDKNTGFIRVVVNK